MLVTVLGFRGHLFESKASHGGYIKHHELRVCWHLYHRDVTQMVRTRIQGKNDKQKTFIYMKLDNLIIF